MSELGSAPVPEASGDDHVRGSAGAAVVLIEYADYECPYCAALHARLAGVSAAGWRIRHVFRHFPVRSSHPRAWPAACAAEAAGLQGCFWEMHDALFADQARLEDPQMWQRASELGLNLERFDADRRSEAVVARVRRDFTSGVRAGVVTTPTLFVDGAAYAGDAAARVLETLVGG
jgi:protein-disulfide isomerase